MTPIDHADMMNRMMTMMRATQPIDCQMATGLSNVPPPWSPPALSCIHIISMVAWVKIIVAKVANILVLSSSDLQPDQNEMLSLKTVYCLVQLRAAPKDRCGLAAKCNTGRPNFLSPPAG